MLKDLLGGCRIILASQSPRRQLLLGEMGLDFEVKVPDVDEIYPAGLSAEEIAIYLAELKADSFPSEELDRGTIIITADTIVSLDGEILGKPLAREDAIDMLRKLSGKMHVVVTGVCLRSGGKRRSFFARTLVWFRELTPKEIEYYVDNFHPFDKAGAYGAQEWIGYIGISRIEGSYFNVMGLPVKELYEELVSFCPNNS
jgi:septum formation protein